MMVPGSGFRVPGPELRRREGGYPAGTRLTRDLTITGHLATGRLGQLYRVWSTSEWCAFTCKILSPERRGERAHTAALRREARILASIRHPHLIRCYGVGEHDGLPFMLLEYFGGPTLFDVLENRPHRRLAVSDALRAVVGLGAAVYHLHRKGYLHLDLKPANLLMRESVPVLIDLDTARRVGSAAPAVRMGTAPYMAPEQVTRGRLTRATDVYGLGALLYELLTGRWPFEDVYLGEDPRAGLERQYPQVAGRPPAPPRTFEHTIPRSLDRTVLKCLAPTPEARFTGMRPLLDVLASEL
ncbi:MAG: serine/threonine-protein kinase [Longimicrobiales bacterium]